MRFCFWQFIKMLLILTSFITFFLVNFVPEILYARAVAPSGDLVNVNDLFGVSFPNETKGWVCGRRGTVLHTSDGGKTWVRQTTGIDLTLSSIHFVDTDNGWAVGKRSTIIHTSNGGRTWKKQESPRFVVEGGKIWVGDAITAEEKATPHLYFMGVHFATAKKGWIAAERTHILHTEDGGKTWQIQFKDEDFILKSVSFCDQLNGWVVGEYGYIYHTSNGGKTWERQAGEFGFSEETGDIIGGDFLFDVVAVDTKTAWVAGIDGYVSQTIDGGATWQKMKKGLPHTHLFGITVDEEHRIIVVGNGTLRVGSNVDPTFHMPKAEPAIRYGWLYGVTPRGKGGFVAVGSNGWIYLSDKNGSFWNRVSGR